MTTKHKKMTTAWTFAATLAALVALAPVSSATYAADAQSFKQDVKTAGKKTGHAVRDAALAIGHGARKAGHAVADATKRGYHATKRAVGGDS